MEIVRLPLGWNLPVPSETHIEKHAAKLCALAGVSIAHHKKHSFQAAVVHIPASDPHAT
jgi:hypothetical protein